jgi:cytoskeletal protein RodZ
VSNFATFTKKSVGTLTLGELLKRLRSEKRINLNDVSRNIKVQLKYLESLENGDFESLPADVYVKGFLKNYADFLGVDSKYFVRLFEKEKGIKKNLEKDKTKKEEKIKPLKISSFSFTPQKIIFVLSFLAVVLVVFFIYKEVGTFSGAPRLVVISPESNSETDEKTVFLEGITEKDSRLFINDQLVVVDDEGKFKEEIALQAGGNIINIKAINKFDKEAEEKITVYSNFKDEVLENNNTEQPTREEVNNSDKINMEVRVDKSPTWLNIEADGNLVFSGTLSNGITQNFEAENKIVISSAKANETFIKLNGKDLGPLGQESGMVKGVVFDKNNK